MKQHISLVVAVAENGVIGKTGALPWYLPADLQHFKAVTMGKPIVMGRRTHESIGRALPGRQNIVVTRNPSYAAPGCQAVGSFEEALAIAKGTEVCVIGGATLYEQALPLADTIYLTRIHAVLDGDVHFPSMDKAQWQVVDCEPHSADAKNPYDYTFLVFKRQRKIKEIYAFKHD